MFSDPAITAALWLLSAQLIAEYGMPGRDPARFRESAPKTLGGFVTLALVHSLLAVLALWPHLGPITTPSLLLLILLQSLLRVAVRGGRGPLAIDYFYRQPGAGEVLLLV
ncbi:MAG: hypothetical protein AAFY88_07425, partial [Acidobacteriota bacterium]